MRLQPIWKFALPLGATLMCWVTMRTVASFSAESMASYGFPFAWYAPDASSSMSFDVALWLVAIASAALMVVEVGLDAHVVG